MTDRPVDEVRLLPCRCPYQCRIPIAAEHLKKMPLPTGNIEDDLLAMVGALTDEMIPQGPPGFGFVQWEVGPPDDVQALFTMDAGYEATITALRAERDEMGAAIAASPAVYRDYGKPYVPRRSRRS